MKKLLSLILSLAVIFVGIIPVSMVSASAGTDATLKDICFENHSVFDFKSGITDYIVEQPYRFSDEGDNFPEPVVSATPTDPNVTVGPKDIVITEDEEEENVWHIAITVTAADGVTTQTYNLTTKPVGQNMYKSGGNSMETGFESGEATGWKARYSGTLSVTDAEAYTGDYSLEYDPADANDYPIPSSFNLNTNNCLTWFSSYAVKSSAGSIQERNYGTVPAPTYIFVDDNGDILTDNTKATNGRNSGCFTAKDAVTGWQRSMRIAKATNNTGYTFQGCASLTDWAAGTTKAYFDDFYMGALVISEIQVSGDTYVKLGEKSTLNYSAKLLNQYGNEGGLKGELTGGTTETVTWKLINAPKDVTIDPATGVVTVPETVTETGDFYVEAQVKNSTFNTSAQSSDTKYLSSYCQTQMGGRIKVSLLPENAEAALADITVNGGGIDEFDENNNADIYVPYSAKDFKFVEPVIVATPVMEGARVDVDIPKPITNNAKITITAYDKSEILSKTYTLTINTVGENLFPDGGFETESKWNYVNGDFGTFSWDIVQDGTDNKVLKAHGQRNTDANSPILLYNGAVGDKTGVYLSPNKTYVNGFMAKLDPDVETHTEKSFCANVMAPGNTTYLPDPNDMTYRRYKFASGYYNQNDGSVVPDSEHSVNYDPYDFELADDWGKYMTVFNSLENEEMRVGMSVGSCQYVQGRETYFLLDNMYIGELIIADVDLTANGQTAAEARQGDEVALTVTAKNQYGNTQGITSDVAYEVINGYQGVSFGENNTVKVADNAAAGTAVIEATVTPKYTGADTDYYVKRRFTLTILPGDGFTYSKDTISAGDVVTTLNYTAQENVNLMIVNALYEIVEGALVFRNCVTDNAISLTAGQRVSKDLTLTVPQTGTYCIKSYLFEKETLKPIFDTIGSLGQ